MLKRMGGRALRLRAVELGVGVRWWHYLFPWLLRRLIHLEIAKLGESTTRPVRKGKR